MISQPQRSVWARVKTLLILLIGGTVTLYAMTFIAWKLGFDPGALFGWSERTSAAVEPVRWLLAAGRLVVMFALWWYWANLVKRWFPDTLPGFAKQREIWMALRHKVFWMFVFLEACLHVSYLGRIG